MEGKSHYWLIYLQRQTMYFMLYVSNGHGSISIDRSIYLLSVISIVIKMPVSVNTRELLLDLHFSVSIPLDYTLFLGCQRILFVPPVSTVCVTLEVLSTSTK